jgi:trigger factor
MREGKSMKKGIILVTTMFMLLLVTGCGKKNDITKDLGYKVSDYVKLGDYKGVEVVLDSTEVTDEDIDAAIQADIEQFTTVEQIKKGTIADGNTVNIDFDGKLNGESFEGGTSNSYDLAIGAGQFIDGFEEQLVGKKVGDKVKVTVTFPKEYERSPDLAGKEVVFDVKINYIHGDPIVPKLNEEFVKTNFQLETIEDYRNSKKETIAKTKKETAETNKISNAWQAAIANAKVSDHPEKEIKEALQRMKDQIKEWASYYKMEYADVLKQEGTSEETFDKDMLSNAQQVVAERLVLYAIIEKENISLSDEEYTKGLDELIKRFNYTDKEEFLKSFEEEEIRNQLIFEKVQKIVVDNAKVVDKLSATEDPAKKDATKEDKATEDPAKKDTTK